MENLIKCSNFDVPLIQCLDSINLSAYYRTFGDSIREGHSYWDCIFLDCKDCMFHTNKCEMNLNFTPKEWVNFMFKDASYIMENYNVNKVLIEQMIKNNMENK